MLGQAFTPLALTLKVAGIATLLALLSGGLCGFLLARHRFLGRELVDALCTLPLVMPPTVLGYYLIVLIGRRGWIGGGVYENFGVSLIFTLQGGALRFAGGGLSRLGGGGLSSRVQVSARRVRGCRPPPRRRGPHAGRLRARRIFPRDAAA